MKNKHLDSLSEKDKSLLKKVIFEELTKKPINELREKLERDLNIIKGGSDDWYLRWCYEPYEQIFKLLEIEILKEYLKDK